MSTMDYNVLIHKKLTGQINESEQRQLDKWLALDPDHRQQFDEIKLIWDNAGEDEEEVIDEHFQQELSKLESAVSNSIQKEQQLQKLKVKTWIDLAVIVLLVALTLYCLFIQFTKQDDVRTVQLVNNHNSEILLSDSSLVILNDSSSIIFSESSTMREATLKGEGFFTVAEETRPFIVHTSKATISVLGTSFIIKDYSDHAEEVIVLRGKVKVSASGKELLLTDGEKTRIENHTDPYKIINEDLNVNAWCSRKLEFNKTELSTILELVSELYDLRFKVKDERILACRFSGTFDHASLEDILKTLSFSLNIEFIPQIGHNVVVSGKGCVP
jgi:transmembrane sensor